MWKYAGGENLPMLARDIGAQDTTAALSEFFFLNILGYQVGGAALSAALRRVYTVLGSIH